jgi:hypothetical protein
VPQSFAIAAEPAGLTYRALRACAQPCCGTFSLVWRHQLSFDASAADVARALRPFPAEEIETSEWPGTQLIGHSATLRKYRLSPDSVRELTRAGGLFGWQSPARPEDLAFYARDGRCWLASIAHEREAFVVVEPDELAALRAAAPTLELKASREAAGEPVGRESSEQEREVQCLRPRRGRA